MQNSSGNMELLPSGNCRLFTVVPACVHDIAQPGRYLEFLGFISDQSCVWSLVSKDEKKDIVWWTIAHSEEFPPGKLALMEHVAWAAPPAWRVHHVESWGWISRYTAPWREELLVASPGCIYPAEYRRTQSCAPWVALPLSLGMEGVVLLGARLGLVRLAVTEACLFFSFILCQALHFWGRKAV